MAGKIALDPLVKQELIEQCKQDPSIAAFMVWVNSITGNQLWLSYRHYYQNAVDARIQMVSNGQDENKILIIRPTSIYDFEGE